MSIYLTELQITRQNVLQLMDSLSVSQLNTIPEGFRNNIAWNAGHLVATQQLLCHKLAGLPMVVSNEFIDKYRKGSAPNGTIDAEAIAHIKKQLSTTIAYTEDAISNHPHLSFTSSYETSYGIVLRSIEDALRFNNTHEGLHLGYMMALKRLV